MCGYETVFECNRDTKRMEVSIGRLWEDESRESERERVRETENVCERTRNRREIENFTPFFDYSRKGGLLGNNFVG